MNKLMIFKKLISNLNKMINLIIIKIKIIWQQGQRPSARLKMNLILMKNLKNASKIQPLKI